MRTRGWFACTFAASVGLAAVFTGGPELRVGHPSGLGFVQQNSPTSKKYVIETMCGGVALFDYNNDGLLDVFFVNGGHLDDPVKCPVRFSRRDPAYWDRLYRQNKDGKLDLFVTRYLEYDLCHAILCAGRFPVYCAPGVFSRTSNILYHNNGDGTFTDVSKEAGLSELKGTGMGMAFGDYDDDGWPDVFVSDDGMEHRLLHNNRKGNFTDRALQAGAAFSEDGKAVSGMGVDFSDYDNDGRPDIVVTDLAAEVWS